MHANAIWSWILIAGVGAYSGCSAADQSTGEKASRTPRARTQDTGTQDASNQVAVGAGNFEWPGWRGPAGNDISAETGLVKSFPAEGPKILWRTPLGTGHSGIAVAGGRVFTLYGSEGREYVAAFAALTGTQLWKVDSDADFAEGRSFGPRSMPRVDGERVFTVGASGQVFCLDVASGNKVWAFNIYDKYEMRPHEEGLSPSPLVVGDKLILLAGRSVFALNKADGNLIWRALDEPMNHASPCLGTIEGRSQLLVLSGSHLVGLSPESGQELWRYAQDAVNIATPVLGPNNQIFLAASYGFGNQLVRIEGNSPRQVYKENTMANQHDTALLHEGSLYGCHDRAGLLKCVDFASGKERWVAREPGKGKLILADGQLIMINEEGTLYLAPISSQSFEPTAEARVLTGTCYTTPSLAQGRLYLRSDLELVCVDMRAP